MTPRPGGDSLIAYQKGERQGTMAILNRLKIGFDPILLETATPTYLNRFNFIKTLEEPATGLTQNQIPLMVKESGGDHDAR